MTEAAQAPEPLLPGAYQVDQGPIGRVIYEPTPRQRVFHLSAAKFRLYGGAAGGGKSHALRIELVRAATAIHRFPCLLLRESFPELQQHIKRFREDIPSELYRWNERDKIATFYATESSLRFGYTSGEGDLQRFQTDEYGAIAFDELTHFTHYQWAYLRSRNRSTSGFRPFMCGATNPGGKGHVWVKSLWIDRLPIIDAVSGRPLPYRPHLYEFIPAKLSDNPHLDKKDPEYRQNLEDMPEAQRRMLLDGDWNVIAGAYFGAVLGGHVTDRRPETWHRKWISCDHGFIHPTVVLWHSQDEEGNVITYRELVRTHTTSTELAAMIVDLSFGEEIDAFYLSPDAWGKRDSERTVADEIGRIIGRELGVMPSRATNARPSGWLLMYDLLKHGMWKIADSCPKLLQTLPLMQRGDPALGEDVEDCKKIDGIDDAPDSARYGLASRAGLVRVPASVRVARRMRELEASHGKVRGQDAVMRARFVETQVKPEGPRLIRFHRRRTA